MRYKLEKMFTFVELHVLAPLFRKTPLFEWIFVIHDTIAYSLLGAFTGIIATWLFKQPSIFIAYGLLAGVVYEFSKEMWLAFMRPTKKEFVEIQKGEWLSRYVIYRSGRWGCYVSLLCQLDWDNSLVVMHVYRQGWVRNMSEGKRIRVYTHREILLPHPWK